ncbi:hypothetical protein [Granulicoccus phenolivorans]|uniref:hypothetical protein n=1 Tax=Granulicoccus phenolivorans TaxID=266854 RepID=UPI00047AC525|nr:hypothetical protein [Granulicoccus phenolivorans]
MSGATSGGGRWAGRVAGALGAAVLAVGVVAPGAHGQDRVEFSITDPQITKASGLAVDYTRGLYWTANDAGNTGQVFGLKPDGSVAGIFEFGATPVDIEAITYTGTRLYVGDIGDKQGAREHITVYFFDNPSFSGDHGGSYRSWDFVYPDGRHDAEAMVVDPNGQLTIITTGQQGGIYRAPARPTAQGVNQLTRVADAPAWITDATALDGDRIAVRTYTTVEILDSQYKSLARAALPYQPQGESITAPLSGDGLLVGSEGTPSDVLRVPVPAAGETTTVPVSSVPPTMEPSAQASAPGQMAAQPDESPTAPGNRSGTLVVLILAALVAVLAGLVAYFWEPWVRGRRRRAAAEVEEETEVLGRVPKEPTDSAAGAEAPAEQPFAPYGARRAAPGPADAGGAAGNEHLGGGVPAAAQSDPTNPQPVVPAADEGMPFDLYASGEFWNTDTPRGDDDDPTNIR